jgi:DNA-binding NtrC family response regulator
MSEKVLLVDDDPRLLGLVQHHLAEEGFETIWAATGEEGLDILANETPDAIILDLLLPGVSGVELLPKLKNNWPQIPVVVLTAQGDVKLVVECMRLGAVDYLPKPFDGTRLATSVRNATTQGQLKARVESLATELRRGEGFDAIIGESAAVKDAITLMQRAATSDIAVLLGGESGTGKEVAARAIHAESARRTGPFVAVNCGAIPEGLIESELFGHEKGSFTGATHTRSGCFEQADGGTLFR